MPCNHKFQSYLNLERLDFEPATLIVGTFNPGLPAGNDAAWFYGRTEECCFWDVLPRIYGESSLIKAPPAEWKRFCKDKRIAITDLVSSIGDADITDPEHNRILGGFSDSGIIHNFDGFQYVDITGLLQSHPAIKNVYFTRSISDLFWRHLWNPVSHYCNRKKIHERKLVAPSCTISYQHSAHNSAHPEDVVLLAEDYILRRWRQEWHF